MLFVPWALKDHDKYFANPSKIEYDEKSGQPKDHTGRPQVRLGSLARTGTVSKSSCHLPFANIEGSPARARLRVELDPPPRRPGEGSREGEGAPGLRA